MKFPVFSILLFCLGILSFPASGQTVSINLTNAISCNGADDGALEADTSGFSASATLSWDTSPASSNATITGLGPGTYTVTLSDTAGTTSASFTLTEPLALALSTQVSDQLCNGVNDGSVTLNPGGGTPPYQYRQGNSGAFGSGNVFANLAPGTYPFTVQDANGCEEATPATVNATTATALTVGVSTTDESCAGADDGSISLNASGGDGPYEYSIDNSGVFSAFNLNGTINIPLSVGTYALTVQDESGCTFTVAANINAANPILVNNAISLPASCGGTDGSMLVSAMGGVAPFVFRLRQGGSVVDTLSSNSASVQFVNIGAGNYNLEVEDSQGCVSPAFQATVGQQSPLQAIVTAVVPSNCAVASGSISLTATNGTANFTYEIFSAGSNNALATIANSSNTTEQFPNLTPGDYDLEITDGNGCIAFASATVPSNSTLTTLITPSCSGSNSGTIDVTVSGTAPFTYQLLQSGLPASTINNSANTSESFGNLAAGTYDVTVTDNTGCIASANSLVVSLVSFSVNPPALINNLCEGGNTGKVVVSVAGGTSPYQFSLLDSNDSLLQTNILLQNMISFDGLSEGGYRIAVEEFEGCQDTSNLVSLVDPAPVLLSSSTTASACTSATGQILVNATGGSGAPYTFSLNPPNAAPNTTGNFDFLSPGIYTITVTDGNLCTASQAATVPQASLPDLLIDTTQSRLRLLCHQDSSGFVQLETGDVLFPFTFKLLNQGGNLLDSTSVSLPNGSVNFDTLTSGIYQAQIVNLQGCENAIFFSIDQPQPLVSRIDTLGSLLDIPCYEGMNGALQLTTQGGTGPYTYQLNAQAITTDSFFSPLDIGTYSFLSTDVNNCTHSFVATVTQPAPDIVSYGPLDTALCNTQDTLRFQGNGKYGNAVFTDANNNPLPFEAGSGTYLLFTDTTVTSVSIQIQGDYPSFNTLSGTNDICPYDTVIDIAVNQLPQIEFLDTPASPLDSLYCLQNPGDTLIARVSQANALIVSRQLSGIGISLVGSDHILNQDTALFIPSVPGIGGGSFHYAVEDEFGCRQEIERQIFVLPNPDISMEIDSACENTAAEFRIVSSFDSSYSDALLQAHLGDPSLMYSRVSDGAQWFFRGIGPVPGDTVENTFLVPGQAIVTLIDQTNLIGCSTQIDSVVLVGALPQTRFSWQNACLGDETRFFNETAPLMGLPDDFISDWSWDFADGFTSTLRDPAHQYADPFPDRRVKLTAITSLGCVSTQAERVYILPVVDQYPFEEDFGILESNQWISIGGYEKDSLWHWGDLSGGPFAGEDNGWYTDFDGSRDTLVDAFLYSVCFDLSSMARPAIELAQWHDNEPDDGTALQLLFSDSPGQEWQTLGGLNAEGIASGLNWYNSNSIFAEPGDQGNGWTFAEKTWELSRHKLDAFQDSGLVRFRLAFAADDRPDTTVMPKGFAIDQFAIRERDRTTVAEVFSDLDRNDSFLEIDRISAGNPQDLVLVHYPWYNSRLFEDNPTPPRARSLYYGISSSEQVVLDGNVFNDELFHLDQTTLDLRALQAAKFSIEADSLIRIKVMEDIPDATEYQVSVLVTELVGDITGSMDSLLVVRKMLPDPGGYTRFSENWESDTNLTKTLLFQPQWDESLRPSPTQVLQRDDYESLSVVVILQELANKEVAQVGFFPIWKELLDPDLLRERGPETPSPSQWYIYPNPTTGLLILEFPELLTKGSEALLYDMQGRVVMRQRLQVEVSREELDLSALGKGVYQLEVKGVGDQVLRERVVVY